MTATALPVEEKTFPNAPAPDEAQLTYFYQWEPVASLPGLSLDECSGAIEGRAYVPKK